MKPQWYTCILDYSPIGLCQPIRYQLKQKGYNQQWNEIVRIMNTQKFVTTSMKNITSQTIVIRQCTVPEQKAMQLYELLGYKNVPFHRKNMKLYL